MASIDPTDYIRLIKQALATDASTAEGEKARQALYDEAGEEAAKLRAAGWTVEELTALVRNETGRAL